MDRLSILPTSVIFSMHTQLMSTARILYWRARKVTGCPLKGAFSCIALSRVCPSRCEALACVGKSVANSEPQLRACEFLLSKQCSDGGWGESYLSCQDKATSCASPLYCARCMC